MKALPRVLYSLCFIGLALVAALALNEVVRPSLVNILLRTVVVATLCGAPGLVHRRLWPLSLLLLPVGAYLLLRTIIPVPSLVEGISGQYHFYIEQLRLGADAYLSQVFPLDSTEVPQLPLLLALSVYWLVGAAAFLSLSLRRPVPGIALMLVLLGFGLTVDGTTRVLWSALLFLVLAACLLVLSRGLKREGWRLRDVVAGGAVGVVASLLALLLLGAAPSAVATPWQDWRTWDPFRQGPSAYTFNWLQQYGDLLDPAKNAVIMKVGSPTPSYWRANVLEQFTGNAWTAGQAFLDGLEQTRSGNAYIYALPEAKTPVPPGLTVTQTFRVQPVYTNYFFVGGDPISLTIERDLVLRTNDTRAIHTNKAVGLSFAYSVTAVVPDLEPADVVGKGSDYPEAVRSYLGLPFPRVAQIEGPDKEATWRSTVPDSTPEGWEWANLYTLNQEIVGSATDPYDVTLRIERYLRDPRYFEYSLTPPSTDFSSPYSAFLFDTRSGFCQHFAGAMALLLRYNGIPARVAVGFTSGEQEEPDTYIVSTNNAHAWVEVYFPGIGWVAFDPTPGRNLPIATSASNPRFINPFVEEGGGGQGTVATEPPRENIPEDRPSGGAASEAREGGWLASAPWVPWVAGLVVLLIAWPAGRSRWRKRRLGRGPLDRRLQASLALLRSEMADYGIAVAPSCTLEETLSIVETKLRIEPDPILISRTDAVLFGGYHATQADFDRAEVLRQEVVTRLRKRHGWVKTGFTWYGVPRLASLGRQGA